MIPLTVHCGFSIATGHGMPVHLRRDHIATLPPSNYAPRP